MSRKQTELFPDVSIDFRCKLKPDRTAIRRKNPSPIARWMEASGFLTRHGITRILDYGCGVGTDVSFLRHCGYEAVGYDPHVPFGFADEPTGCFDLVLCLFVLNVIADPSERFEVGQRIISHTRSGGIVAVATRSVKAINTQAIRKSWTRYSDGFLSSPERGTFQRGISGEEITSYFGSGLVGTLAESVKAPADSCLRLLTKP